MSACRARRHSRRPRPARGSRPWEPARSAGRSRAARTPECAPRSPGALARLDIRRRHRPGRLPVPAVEAREVAFLPLLAEPGGTQIPVRADLLAGFAQVT